MNAFVLSKPLAAAIVAGCIVTFGVGLQYSPFAGPQAIALTFKTDVTGNKAVQRLIRASKGRLAWLDERLVYARETRDAAERQHVTLKLINKLGESLTRCLP